MEESQEGRNGQQPYRRIAAARIRELSSVDENVPLLLRTSGSAISQLTNRPVAAPSPTPSGDSPAQRLAAFDTLTKDLYASIHSIRQSLYSQIDSLLQQQVIAADAPKKYVPPTQGPGGSPGGAHVVRDLEAGITNGGLGDLDIGVLNANARAGRDADDVFERAKAILESLRDAERQEANEEMGDG